MMKTFSIALSPFAGAILFKGFSVEEAIHFQEVVQSIEKELSNEYRGTSPRQLIPGTQVKYTMHLEGLNSCLSLSSLFSLPVSYLLAIPFHNI